MDTGFYGMPTDIRFPVDVIHKGRIGGNHGAEGSSY
jgi:hypothetical protein